MQIKKHHCQSLSLDAKLSLNEIRAQAKKKKFVRQNKNRRHWGALPLSVALNLLPFHPFFSVDLDPPLLYHRTRSRLPEYNYRKRAAGEDRE